jgi:glycosyltransferase involved in cell wall biosynthesis
MDVRLGVGGHADERLAPILSICIPTYNRRDRAVRLVNHLLRTEGRFEVCVHVDGSADGTYEALTGIDAARLRIARAPNQGRAGALLSACRLARGRFSMVFDDDDTLSDEGLRTILSDCLTPLPAGMVGYIYHFEDAQGARIGGAFPVGRANFLSLRADFGVKGDKKEVVLTDALRSVVYDGGGRFRRTPTSLMWSRLALSFDVGCRNIVIGRKSYLEGGMSANSRRLKSENAYPMLLLYVSHVVGFWRGRYRSRRYLAKAVVGVFAYAFRSILAGARA